jgi:hypothetical protein
LLGEPKPGCGRWRSARSPPRCPSTGRFRPGATGPCTTAKPSWPRCYLVPHDAARRDSDSVVRCLVLQRAADRCSETQEPRLWERVSCGKVAARYVPPALFATQTSPSSRVQVRRGALRGATDRPVGPPSRRVSAREDHRVARSGTLLWLASRSETGRLGPNATLRPSPKRAAGSRSAVLGQHPGSAG